MRWQVPIFADVTEAAAADVESADFCGNRCGHEDEDKQGQDRQSPEIKAARDQSDSAQNFEPGQIKREPNTDCPRQNFVIIDVVGEMNRIECFNRTGINENSADDNVHQSPNELRNV